MNSKKQDRLNALRSQLQELRNKFDKMSFHKTRIVSEKEWKLLKQIKELDENNS